MKRFSIIVAGIFLCCLAMRTGEAVSDKTDVRQSQKLKIKAKFSHEGSMVPAGEMLLRNNY